MKTWTKRALWTVLGLSIAAGVVGCGDNSTTQEGTPPPASSFKTDTRRTADGQGGGPIDPRANSGPQRSAPGQ